MPEKYYASRERGLDSSRNYRADIEKLIGEEVTIVVEAYSMSERGYRGNNEYFYTPPRINQWTGKLAKVLDYGLLVEGNGGYDAQIQYLDGFKKLPVPEGQGYFPFGDSTTYYEGESYSKAERAEIDRVTILSVTHKGNIVYKQNSVFDNLPGNYHPR